MCVVSMIGDHYSEKWREVWPQVTTPTFQFELAVTRAEFDALKRDVEECKALLRRAKQYDKDNDEPDCEIEEKMELIRRVAKAVGVDLEL